MAVYPLSKPSNSGTDITVDLLSKQPTIVARILNNVRQNDFWLSDLLYVPSGTAPSGAVVYSQITGVNENFATRSFEEVGPGDEVPVIGSTRPSPSTAYTSKRGAAWKITKESISRNDIATVNNDMMAAYNSAKLASDTKAIAAANASSFLTQAASAAWSTNTTKIRNDLQTARAAVENTQLGKIEGYRVDTLVVASDMWLNITLNDQLMDAFYKSYQGDQAAKLVNNGILDGILGIPRVRLNPWLSAGDRWLFDSTKFGRQISEYPLALESEYDMRRQTTWYQLTESDAFVVPHPKALIKITG